MKMFLTAVKDRLQDRINFKNRSRLTNLTPTIITSNCTGRFLYHWLGLEFRSPFINLYMTPEDFLTAMEHFEEFMHTEIYEGEGKDYPIGIGAYNTKIHFMHYKTFKDAVAKWKSRTQRMDVENMGISLTNWNGITKELVRFDKLPFRNKVVFTDEEFPEIESVFCIKGYDCKNGKNGNIYATQTITGKRYIDQFDYVEWINSFKK